MKKISLMLLFFLSVSLSSFAETADVKDGRETVGTVTYEVSKIYINREGWGNTYTIKVENNTNEYIQVRVTAKGCGDTDSARIKPYGSEEIGIATGEKEATGWHVEAYVE